MDTNQLPRELPSGWQLAGNGRTPGSVIYFAPLSNRTREFLIGKVAFAGQRSSTIVFEESPAIPPVTIDGDSASHQLAVGKKLLVEVTFTGPGAARAASWFRINNNPQTAKRTTKPAPKSAQQPKPKRISGVVIMVAADFRFAFAESADGTRYYVPSKACTRPLRINEVVSFLAKASVTGPLPEAVNVIAA